MKKSNGVNSQSLLIFIHTNKTAKDCDSEVVKWFLNCLTPWAESTSNKCGQCDFNIISNIKDNDYFDEDDKKTYNKIVIALQNGQQPDAFNSVRDDEDLIIIDEEPKNYILNPAEILNLLKEEPEYVTKIGVSGVSTKCMKQYWSEMINDEPDIFDIPGKGYMQHPMWMYIGNGWAGVRERSFNFGWDEYP
tara:strand:- start:69 stop:641 length:573 start_codon:yes stop_codon:yes gene_type:complete